MTIDRQHGRLVLSCDSCDEVLEGDGAEDACPAFFDAFLEGAKANGWRPYKVRGEWMHSCPECTK